jgi:cytochrome b561
MNLIKQQRYATFSIVLHWIIFLLLIAVCSCIELREIYPKGTEPRELFKTWHFKLFDDLYANRRLVDIKR